MMSFSVSFLTVLMPAMSGCFVTSSPEINSTEPINVSCILNNGHIGDELFVHCSEVVFCSEANRYVYGQYTGRGEQFVHCREVVHSSECLYLEVPLLVKMCVFAS